MRRITADYIFPVSSAPIKNGIVEVDDYGTIINIIDTAGKPTESAYLEHYNGVLVPGFVNAHCHLELSVYKQFPFEAEGLPAFIKKIVSSRNQPEEMQLKAIVDADAEMCNNGIVAVGDISNNSLSFETKQRSTIDYYTFVEVFKMGSNDIADTIKGGHKLVSQAHDLSLKASIVPHAPYTVTPNLYKAIQAAYQSENLVYSIHNQETPSEDAMYIDQSGDLVNLFQSWGSDMSIFPTTGKSSLQSTASFFPEGHNKLLIHNTFSTEHDFSFIKSWLRNTFLVLCPNSNLIIEKQLPNIPAMLNAGLCMALGTDSYASNHQLSVLSEMLTIHEHFPTISFQSLLQMATLNGAKALKVDHCFGRLEIGMKPGLNLITNFDYQTSNITKKSNVKVLLP